MRKTFGAALLGLLLVATPLLAQQLGWQDRNPILVGADGDTFAQRCVELYTNKTVWEALRASALERIRMECSIEAFEDSVKHCLNGIAATGVPLNARMDR